MTDEEIGVLRKEIPGWAVVLRDGVQQLQRDYYPFDRFVRAFSFATDVAILAERAKHDPIIVTAWNKVRVNWYTHQIGGLHLNDFVMAAKTDVAHEENRKSWRDLIEVLFEESPMIQEMCQKWYEEGYQESLQQRIVNVIHARYPSLAEFAQNRVSHFDKLDVLESLLQQVTTAPDAETVRKLFAEGEN
jgi:4a-hydroxytetrahydrobiopterin dehydratase